MNISPDSLPKIFDSPKKIHKSIHPQNLSGLICGDVIKVLNAHNSSSLYDLIIADPPYNIGKDFGNGDEKKSTEEYVHWSKEWLSLCFKLLKDDGIIYVYGFSEILAHLSVLFPLKSQRWLIWHYTNKTVPSSKFWQRSHESILCLWKSDFVPKLKTDQIREPYTNGYKINIGKSRAGTKSRFGGGKKTIYRDYGGALPRDVLKIPALAGGAGSSERWFMCYDCDREVFHPSEIKNHRKCRIMKHPTQKPMQLTKKLIQSAISKNSFSQSRLLIPFAGSGSECVVANEMGIKWCGIEMNKEYIEFANKWIKQSNV